MNIGGALLGKLFVLVRGNTTDKRLKRLSQGATWVVSFELLLARGAIQSDLFRQYTLSMLRIRFEIQGNVCIKSWNISFYILILRSLRSRSIALFFQIKPVSICLRWLLWIDLATFRHYQWIIHWNSACQDLWVLLVHDFKISATRRFVRRWMIWYGNTKIASRIIFLGWRFRLLSFLMKLNACLLL